MTLFQKQWIHPQVIVESNQENHTNFIKSSIQMTKITTGLYLKAAVPNLFGTRDWFHGRIFFHGPGLGRGEWFQDDSSALHLLYTLFLLLSHFQLHLRSSGIRSLIIKKMWDRHPVSRCSNWTQPCLLQDFPPPSLNFLLHLNFSTFKKQSFNLPIFCSLFIFSNCILLSFP